MPTVRVKPELPADIEEDRVSEALNNLSVAVVRRIHSLAHNGLRMDRLDNERLCLGVRAYDLDLVCRWVEVVP